MSDSLETASAVGLSLRPTRSDEPAIRALSPSVSLMDAGFESMIERWLPLTYVMNNLSRGLGLADAYPFVLSPVVIEKLHFIYDTINASRPAAADAITASVAKTAPEERAA